MSSSVDYCQECGGGWPFLCRTCDGTGVDPQGVEHARHLDEIRQRQYDHEQREQSMADAITSAFVGVPFGFNAPDPPDR